ncbi:sulfonate ABC transporter substrate-binding protein [Cohnella cholangitidis]|uniref:Putative aliphatic sulfonates-binding protein n=1 Tax=Cohnella cholangitidis TaxID=2598458 RepID=A0A7G5BY03_9BACL|nr:sulfonate ABC transporter substrate-binding protein [Cohnella cholangitidis]QMV41837.1 sulfonate ABC transporter substrate-binding protein [Cohnella cholangitidis]
MKNTIQKNNKLVSGVIVLALVFALTLLSACGSKNNEAGSPSAKASSASPSAASSPSEEAASPSVEANKTIRIGYQKYASINILKEKGGLEDKLKEIGYKVEWTQFPGGPQLLEAVNVGSIDFGNVGEAPPIFAQAAGTPLVYLGHSPASPKAEAILVPENSPIKTGADLKGKKVALNKGSNVHYLLVKYLEKEGLKYSDIEVVFLPPADARAAFESGNVDAWVIWEPFYSAAQLATKARVLADGEGLVDNYEYYLSTRKFAENDKAAVDVLLEQLNESDKWAKENQSEVAKLLAPALGLDIPSLEQALSHRGFGVEPITDDIIAAQQKIADVFFELKLIPTAIDINDAILK